MHEDSYRYDCYTCKYCYKCYDGVSLQTPPGLKGHSMVASRHGVVIYGGITWNDVDMDKADDLGKQKAIYIDKCKDVIDKLSVK